MATYEDLIKQGYSYSDEAKRYKTQLDTTMANKPGQYQSAYSSQLGDLYNQITNMQRPTEMTNLYNQILNRQTPAQLTELFEQINNRGPFTYDLNGDALYQQYKNQYQTMGKQAMKDTMGQAAALTGGYGSTYGQAVGQQQYNAYLSQLNDKIPELYQLARSNYDADTNNLMQRYQFARDAYDTETNDLYKRYQLASDQYDADRSDLYSRYNLVQSRDDTEYGRWKDQLASWQDDVNLYNSLFQNERNWDYGLWQDNISYLMQLAQMAMSGGGGGGRGRGGGGGGEEEEKKTNTNQKKNKPVKIADYNTPMMSVGAKFPGLIAGREITQWTK